MRGKEMQQEIVKGLTKNKIHLSEIQETHITRFSNYMMDNYRIITASDKNEETGIVTGGTAIVVHESLQQHITQITRQSGRSIRVTLGHAKSKMPIRIISTYAPHIRHTEEEKRQQWEDVKELLYKTCGRHLVIWGSDANGQLGNRNREEEENTPTRNIPIKK